MQPSIFNYNDARIFLCDWLNTRQKTDPRFSVRKWAGEMGVSHALLVMILQAKRSISLRHESVITHSLKLNHIERSYLKAMIEARAAKSLKERAAAAERMRSINPDGEHRVKDIEEFNHISSWLHMAILSFVKLSDWDGKRKTLHVRFRSLAKPMEINSALEKLEALGLLTPDTNGIPRPTHYRVSTRDDVASEAVRRYHQKASELASSLVETQDVSEREFQSFTLAINPQRIAVAKEMIRDFRIKLARALESDDASEIYHVNLHLFRLTQNPLAKSRVEDESTDKGTFSSKGVSYVPDHEKHA